MKFSVCTIICILCLSACSRRDEDASTSKRDPVTGRILPTPPRADLVTEGKAALANQSANLFQNDGTTGGVAMQDPLVSGKSFMETAVDQRMAPFGPSRQSFTLENVIVSSFVISGFSFLVAQQFYRHRQKVDFNLWQNLKTAGIGFGAAGLCASSLMYLRFRAEQAPRPSPSYEYVVPVQDDSQQRSHR